MAIVSALVVAIVVMTVTMTMVVIVSMALTVIAIVAVAMTMVAIVVVIMTIVIAPLATLLMMFIALAIVRDIDIVVPAIVHEIDAASAGVILITMLAPVLGVSRRHTQVERLFGDGHTLHEHW